MIQSAYYFAYGSNMSRDRLQDRLGKVKKIGTAVLPGYNLIFNCGWKSRSVANIIKTSENDKVEGVIYELDDYQIFELDRYEGWPYSYEKFFFMSEGRILFGYHSVSEFFKSDAYPSYPYLCLLIDGAQENKLKYTLEKLQKYEEDNYIPA